MKKAISAVLSVLLLFGSFSLCFPAIAANIENSKKYTVIAEFESAPVSKLFGGKGVPSAAQSSALLKKLRLERTAPIAQMAKVVSNFKIRNSCTNLLNAVSFEATKSEMEAVKAIKGVKAVYQAPKIKAIEVTSPTDISSGSMIGVDKLHEMGLDGKGTAVAIIDGGFNCDHEAFALSDPSSAKYSKNDIEAILSANEMAFDPMTADDVYKNPKIPFAFDYLEGDPILDDDNNSDPDHGTHVSGIAAGNGGNITGVAPEAQVLMFKIDVYDDQAFLDNMLCTIDDAAKFDISSINLSVGMAFEMPDDPAYELLNEAFDRAREKGILICCAAGNEGMFNNSVNDPDYSVNGIPNSFPSATSIASVDNTNLSQKIKSNMLAAFADSDGNQYEVMDYTIFPSFTDKSAEVVKITVDGLFTPKYDLNGKYALITEHIAISPSRWKKYERVLQRSEPLGLICTYELMPYAADLSYYCNYPIAIMTSSAYALSHALPTTVTPVFQEFYAEPASVLEASYYTSYGLSENLEMTVDIAAPGGIIYSSVAEGYDIYSGTSMAAPHITGAAALLDQYLSEKYPSITGAEKADLKENLLMSTADAVVYNNCAISPRGLGAGLVNLEEAVKTNAVLTDSSGKTALNIGEITGETFELTFNVKNISDSPITYDTVSFDVITDKAEQAKIFNNETGEYSSDYYLNGESRPLDFEVASCTLTEPLTVDAGETAQVSAQIALNADELAENAKIFENGFFVEGYAYLSDSGNEQTTVNMPFLGFYGDWFKSPALEINDFNNDYHVLRALKSLTAELIDEAGNVVYSDSDEFLQKDSYGSAADIIYKNVDAEIPDGEYRVRLVAAINAEGGEEKTQVFDLKLPFIIGNAAPEIISVTSTKNADGTYDVTFITNSKYIKMIEAYGARVSNRRFYDIYMFDGIGEKVENGYAYTLKSLAQNPNSLYFEVTDNNYIYSVYGSPSLFARIILSIENTINTFLMVFGII